MFPWFRQKSTQVEFFQRPAEKTVYGFNGYKIQGIYQKFGMDIVHTRNVKL